MGVFTLFLCGDVMTGRGIDQILLRPSDPVIHERFMRGALGYVELAEQEHGPVPRRVQPAYIWGEALDELARVKPDARIINLETAVTQSEDWLDKGINYRMHPENVSCLTAAAIDCCTLANNHVLDWGTSGLTETLDTLKKAGIKTTGAGRNRAEASARAEISTSSGARILINSFGARSSGIPLEWAATDEAPGVDFLEDLSATTAERIGQRMHAARRPGDVVVASIHWGGNWGYEISAAETRFAHRLIDAGVDLIHGHSSHHPKGIEVYRDKLILYGCGDFINDYEGIEGYEAYRSELGLMYFPTVSAETGQLVRFELVPTQIKRFRVHRVSPADSRWLSMLLDREGRRFGTRTDLRPDHRIELRWGSQ